MVRLTLGVPILLVGLQLALVGNQLSFDVTKLATWTNAEEVFALPLGTFALLAAVTSLIGLYHRSMLLNRQLEKVQEQIAISNKQLNRSEKQFELALNQFALAQKKENFVLYLEHRKLIESGVKELLSQTKGFNFSEDSRFGEYQLRFDKFYELAFPENAFNELKNFNLKSTAPHFESRYKDYIAKLEELHITAINKELNEQVLYFGLIEGLFSTGLTYKPKQKLTNESIVNLAVEALDEVVFISVVLLHFNLISEVSFGTSKSLIEQINEIIKEK